MRAAFAAHPDKNLYTLSPSKAENPIAATLNVPLRQTALTALTPSYRISNSTAIAEVFSRIDHKLLA